MIVLPESTAEKRLAWKRTEAFYTHTVVALLIHVLLSLIGFLTASMAVLSRAAFFAKVHLLKQPNFSFKLKRFATELSTALFLVAIFPVRIHTYLE